MRFKFIGVDRKPSIVEFKKTTSARNIRVIGNVHDNHEMLRGNLVWKLIKRDD